MKRALYIAVYLVCFLATGSAYAQTPKFRDLPDQQYLVGTTIAPLAPDMRSASGPVPTNIYGQVITLAGTGSPGFNNGKGTGASFNSPMDVKMDALGNLYVADAGNNAIRKIAPDGTVTTFAGTGTAGYADGPASSAMFKFPCGLAFDAQGNLFIADTQNQLIRKIDPLGQVTIFAGIPGVSGNTNNTFDGPTGLVADNKGNVYVTDRNNIMVRKVPGGYILPFAGSTNGDQNNINGPGVQATFMYGLGDIIIGNDGNFYVADSEMIRRITPSAVVSTYAGVHKAYGNEVGDPKTAIFTSTFGLLMDKAGIMFITDKGSGVVRRYGNKNFISQLAGKGSGNFDAIGLNARFNNPSGMCIDAQGFLYIADAGNNTIRKVSTTGYTIIPEKLPDGLVFDRTTGIITGKPTKVWPLTNYTIFGYNTDGEGQYSVNIQVNEEIRQPQIINFPPFANKLQTDADFPVGASSSPSPGSNFPIIYTSDDVSVASIYDNKVRINGYGTVTITATKQGDPFYFDAQPVSRTLVVQEVKPVYDHPVISPKASPILAPLDSTGHLTLRYTDVATVTDVPPHSDAERVIVLQDSLYDCGKIGPQTALIKAGYGPDPIDPLSAKFNYPSNITYDRSSAKMYISDKGNYRVRSIGTDGRVGTLAGSGLTTPINGKGKIAGFGNELLSLTTDAQGNVYVCDVQYSLIRKITPDGFVSTFASEALIPFNDYDPLTTYAVVGGPDGYIYAADRNRIYKIAPDGNSATVFAGSGKNAITDGLGALADFTGITGLFFGPNGNLYVSTSDLNDVNTVRVVTPAGLVTTLFRRTDPLMRFTRLVVDSKGNAYVASSEPKIYKVDATGTLSIFAGSPSRIGKIDGDGVTVASFNNPQGIAIDPQDNIYIADEDNHRIRKITPAGMVSTIAGGGNGYVDNSNETNKQSTSIPFIVTSPVKIKGKFPPLVIPYLDACPAVVANYTNATGTSNCGATITFSQNIAPGTVLSDGQTVILKLLASDNLSPYDTASVSFSITAKRLPTPTVTVTADTYDACEGQQVTFTAKPENEGKNPTYQWLVNGTAIAGQTGTQFSTAALKNGDNVTCVVTNHDGCVDVASAPSKAVTVGVSSPLNLAVNIFSSVTDPACRGSLIKFTAVPVNVPSSYQTSYQWQVNGVNKGTNSTEFSSSMLGSGDVVTCIMTSNGRCQLNPSIPSNAITANVLPDDQCAVVIPNTFTPNGDGTNDYWNIPVLKNYPNSTVSIYNRNGQLLYQSIGYAKPWDGTYQGKQLPAATYYYIVDTHTYRNVVAGWVMIVR